MCVGVLGGGGGPSDLETAQSPKSPFPFWIWDFGLVNFGVLLLRRKDADLTPYHLLCSERD